MPTPFSPAIIDHTLLKPEASWAEVERVVRETVEFGFATACVSPCFVADVARQLRGTAVKTCTVIGFPHGTNRATVKAIEATVAVKDGAEELDVVAHLPALAAANGAAVKAELIEVVRACRAVRSDVVVKVIVESAYLLSLGADRGEAALAAACHACRESGCDYIKTSTGFHPSGGASVPAVEAMKRHGDGLLIKASGGIRDLATAQSMLAAGADRLGLSSSVALLRELRSTL